ncbi:MAG TPA: cytochrome c [Baekduia sp.]|nr:cytochrome c [Baekduia sp.]
MIATTALVLLFVLLALSVLFVAMRGGPAKAVASGPQTLGSRRIWTVFVPLVLLVLGLALPYLILSANSSGRDKDAVGGVELTDTQARGREMFAQNCATCHTLRGANATGRVGPNLDELQAVQNTAFTLDAIAKGRAKGAGQMPSGLLSGDDAEQVADFVKAVAGR